MNKNKPTMHKPSSVRSKVQLSTQADPGRRHFLRSAIASSALFATGALPALSRHAHAAYAPVNNPIYANLMLSGGPDFRHILPPAFNDSPDSYGYQFWKNRAAAYNLNNSETAWRNHWNSKFDARSSGGHSFGISRQCGWLKQMWDQGNVAIINNVVGAQTRDHDHCQLVLDQGNRNSQPNDYERSGWGGRLATAAGGASVSLTPVPRHFSYGAHPSGDINMYDNTNMISAPDMRAVSLFVPDEQQDQRYDTQGQIARTLRSYYAGLSQTLPSDSPYYVYLDHEKELREFGQIIDARLNSVPEPYKLRRLYEYTLGNTLSNISFGKQLANLHDAIACHDLLNMRTVSLEYDGFDSHDGQKGMIEPRFNELFGANQGLQSLWESLPSNAQNNIVFGVMGEFGRQLKSNGGNGTDHGRGNSMLLIGNRVKGGIYGDMFPDEELARLEEPSPDIHGLTEFDRPLGAVCEWVKPGSMYSVFPDVANSLLENNVDLSSIVT